MIKNGDRCGYSVVAACIDESQKQWQPITNPTPRSSRPRTTWRGSSPSTGRSRLILLLATFVWGWYGYHNMPKRKDPDIPVRVASAQCQWPGATAEQVEQLVTRPIEQAAAQNTTIRPPSPSNFGIRSLSFPGLSVVYIQLDDNVKDKQKQFSDINLKLNQLNTAAARRRAHPVQQQLRRHGGADADRRQPQRRLRPRSRCGPSPSARPSKRLAPHLRQERAAAARQRHLCLSAVGGGRTGAQQFREHRRDRTPQRHAERSALLRRPGLRRPRRQHHVRRRNHSPARRTADQEQSSPLRALSRRLAAGHHSRSRRTPRPNWPKSPAQNIPIASSTTTPT